MNGHQDKPLVDPLVAAGWYIDIAYHLVRELASMQDMEGRAMRVMRLRELHERISGLLRPAAGLDPRAAQSFEQLLELEALLRAEGYLR
jgi:hypothetical protein